jgi:hypothetical protein
MRPKKYVCPVLENDLREASDRSMFNVNVASGIARDDGFSAIEHV